MRRLIAFLLGLALVLVMAVTTIGVRHSAVLRSGPKKVTLEQIWLRKRNDANGPKMMFVS